jgi:hypothetical protein
LLFAGFILPALPVHADRVVFTDGSFYDGRVDIVDGMVRLQVEKAQISYPIRLVERVEWGVRTVEEEYAERAGDLAADDVEGHAALARWCRDRHLLASYRKELLAVGRADPLHPMAAALELHGYVLRDGEWVTLEFAMLKEGKRRFRGEWLTESEIRSRVAAERNEPAGNKAAPAARPAPAPKRDLRDNPDPARTRPHRRRYRLSIGVGGGLIDERGAD